MSSTLESILAPVLQTSNEILTATIVIMAASLLLYNLTRNLRNRVARSSAAVLACVTLTYVFDVFISLEPIPGIEEIALRMQWIGIAFIPAALFHLSDTLLDTTGLPSRGRRRRVVRILYAISGAFLLAATLTDILVIPVYQPGGVSLSAGWFFPIFVLYFLIASIATFLFLDRARRRALSRSSQRRMAYLQSAILTPALGIFPFGVLLDPADIFSLNVLLIVNIANIVVILMLILLSYPLSFFGSDKPDRVVKVELLRFLLRGPGTGMLAVATIILTTQASRIFGLPGTDFMPFAVVAVVLLWEWIVALSLPWLEKTLIYANDDEDQIAKLQDLSDRILTHSDLLRLIEATLEATCDYLRVPVAFVASHDGTQLETVRQVGHGFDEAQLEAHQVDLLKVVKTLSLSDRDHLPLFVTWNHYQVTPLYSSRNNSNGTGPTLIGVMGIKSDNLPDGEDEQVMLNRFVERAEQTLDDLALQTEIFAALEGLLPQISTTRTRADYIEYRPGRNRPGVGTINAPLPAREEVYEQVRAALRQYWGGPGITRSRLMELQVVQEEAHNTGNPTQALRNVLLRAIERLKPDGERSMFSVEWTVFNILDLRFIEGKKVKDVVQRMSMSDADFYRKQRVAIQAVADTILAMERESTQGIDTMSQ